MENISKHHIKAASKTPASKTKTTSLKLVKNSSVVTIWWCIWGWVGWLCCRLEIWWNMSCISVSLALDGAAAQAHTCISTKGKKKRTSISFYLCSCCDRPQGQLILSGRCWCLTWEHAGWAYSKGGIRHKFTITNVTMKTELYLYKICEVELQSAAERKSLYRCLFIFFSTISYNSNSFYPYRIAAVLPLKRAY